MILWRISNHVSLEGEGSLRASGRWHTRGRRVLYCAQSPAAALLETLVHFQIDIADLPARYRLLKIDAPGTAAFEEVALGELPKDWIENTSVTRSIGDAWLAEARSALLIVPSAIVPETYNLLLNPAHSDAGGVRIVDVREHVIDPRLIT